ncbi:hypothetical protein [Marmoricola sp. URHA0025 HA25]
MTALAAAAMAAVAPGKASATAPCSRTYSTNTSVPITDFVISSSVINVPEDGLVVTDVNLTLNIHHTDDADLHIWVQSENDAGVGRRSTFLYDESDAGDNMIGTTFDDSAPNDISTGVAPFTGSFNPVGAMSTLNGFAGGQYRLLVWDDAAIDQGTIDNWSVTLTYASCDPDNDGIDVPPDACPALAGIAPSGCPSATGSLTAKYRLGKFKGTLSSSAAACKGSRLVTIFKVRSGPDKRIGTAATAGDGTYKLKRAKSAGRYYAMTPRVVVPNAADCAAATSSTFRVR